ncbi:hypothetical protein TWF106_007761 [Orbilia oligospora]|uniref:Uncharacterized protein n=1 Tax=Orbilia oligospora TaxID=2813651 RepID=A0A7C8UJP8_ORBOL|nr:hypothetical protein TWF106_007761 [Orbilia oligospora]
MDRKPSFHSMKGRTPTDILTMQTLENKARTQTMKSIPRPPTLTNIQTGLSFGTIPNILGQKGSPITQSPVGMQNLRMNFVAPETQPAPENANREGPWNALSDVKILDLNDMSYTEHTEATYIEIYHYPTAESRVFQGSLDDSNYEDWLEQGPHVNKGEQPTSGCRLILTRRPQFGLAALVPMLIRKDHVAKTAEKWGFDDDFLEQMILWSSLTKRKNIPKKQFQFISRLVNGTDQGSSCSVISFNPDTNITYGMVMGLYSDEQIQTHGTNLVMWETHMFHERTLHSIKWTWHPVAHAIIQIDETLRFFQIIARLASIRVVEMSHSAGIMQMTTSGEMVPLAEALARDYTTDTASLAMQSAQMAMCQTALESNMAILEDLIETIAEIESIAPSTKEIRPYLMAEINNLKSRCNSSTLYAQGIQRNISFTQTAIYNLIAQRDSKVNIELAKDSRMLAIASKRDSSSMKTIAVLTIVFLPGTFVSALFAMPVLNWEAKSYPEVTTDKFWVYWAVTLPMTLLVILTWIVWTKRQSWLNRKDHEEGMKTYDEVDVEKAMMESKDPEKIPLKADFEGGNTAGGVDSRRHRWFSMGSKSEGRKRHHGD